MRALLLIPPTGLFFREDRCQTPIDSPAFAQPPITLTYMAAALETAGAQCRVHDYPVSGGSWDDLESDVAAFRPDLVRLAPVATTFESDLRAASIVKRLRSQAVTLIKAGNLTPDEAAESIDAHPDLDIALMGEYEATLQELLPHLARGEARGLSPLSQLGAVEGVVHREAGAPVFTGFRKRAKNLDALEGFDHFSPAMRSGQLTRNEVFRLWRRANLSIWLSPSHVLRTLRRIRSPRVFLNYLRYGLDALRGFAQARADR